MNNANISNLQELAKPAECPYCGLLFKGTRTLGNAPSMVAPGHPLLCRQCYNLSYFTLDLTLRKAEADELAELEKSSIWPTIQKLRARGNGPRIFIFSFRKSDAEGGLTA